MKLKNPLAKGKRAELEAKKMLEKEGYIVLKTIHTRYGPKDFFGLFDLIAFKKNKETRFIQVKSNRFDKKTFDNIITFSEKHFKQGELWVRHDGGAWVKNFADFEFDSICNYCKGETARITFEKKDVPFPIPEQIKKQDIKIIANVCIRCRKVKSTEDFYEDKYYNK